MSDCRRSTIRRRWQIERIEERAELAAYFGRNVPLHIYELGDLDDRFWPRTTYYGRRVNGELDAVVLVYDDGDHVTVLALEGDDRGCAEILGAIHDALPGEFYTHLSPHLVDNPLRLSHAKPATKMLLMGDGFGDVETGDAVLLTPDDADEVRTFLDMAYPGNWFDPWMLETQTYVGYHDGNELIAAGGTHVYAPRYGVAALGNVAVHPEHRGKGLGRRLVAAICQRLAADCDQIGLNVMRDNVAAIACYEGLGFRWVADYVEGPVTGSDRD